MVSTLLLHIFALFPFQVDADMITHTGYTAICDLCYIVMCVSAPHVQVLCCVRVLLCIIGVQ